MLRVDRETYRNAQRERHCKAYLAVGQRVLLSAFTGKSRQLDVPVASEVLCTVAGSGPGDHEEAQRHAEAARPGASGSQRRQT